MPRAPSTLPSMVMLPLLIFSSPLMQLMQLMSVDLPELVQQHAATFIAQAGAEAGADLPPFVKAEFDAFLGCGSLAHGFLRLRCGDRGNDKLIANCCQRRSSFPSCGARRRAQMAAHRVDHVIARCRCASGCFHSGADDRRERGGDNPFDAGGLVPA